MRVRFLSAAALALAVSTNVRGAEPARPVQAPAKAAASANTSKSKAAPAAAPAEKKSEPARAGQPAGVAEITDGPPQPIASPDVSPRATFELNLEPTGGRMPPIELVSQKQRVQGKTLKSVAPAEPKPLASDAELFPITPPGVPAKSAGKKTAESAPSETTKSGKIQLKPFVPDELEDPATENAALHERIKGVLTHYFTRKLNTRDHNHWEIMHQIVAYGVKTEILKNGPHGEPVNAISYECWNQICRGETMLYRMGDLPAARQGPRVQGHEGQFLKMLAMAGVSKDYPMMVDGKVFKVADLIEQEKLTCRSGIELTFKLIPLAYYLEDIDETWTARDRTTWGIERLIKEELTQPILRDAACGGTHRLMGFSMSVRQRRRSGKPISGEFERAERYVDDYIKYTLGLQNSDGSFSTEWFRGKANSPSIDRRLQTTGHILEWLVFSLPDEKLTEPRIVKAVEYLTKIMAEDRDRQWEIGPMGHALHALSIYEKRVFKPAPSITPEKPAEPTPTVEADKPEGKKAEAAEAPANLPPRTAARPKRSVPKKVVSEPVVDEEKPEASPAKPEAKEPVKPAKPEVKEPAKVEAKEPVKSEAKAPAKVELKQPLAPADVEPLEAPSLEDEKPEGKKPAEEKKPVAEEKKPEGKQPEKEPTDEDLPLADEKPEEKKPADKKDKEPADKEASEKEPADKEPAAGDESKPEEKPVEKPAEEKAEEKKPEEKAEEPKSEEKGPSFPGLSKKGKPAPKVGDLWDQLDPTAGRLPSARPVGTTLRSKTPPTGRGDAKAPPAKTTGK